MRTIKMYSQHELMATGEKGQGEGQRVWDGRLHTAVFKTDNHQGPTV